MEALFNYQTLITELTGLPIANASLLDEATAAAEAMLLAYNSTRDKKTVIVDKDIFPQTLAVLETRAKPLGIEIKMLDIFDTIDLIEFDDAFAMIVQLPNKNGQLKYCDALLRVSEV